MKWKRSKKAQQEAKEKKSSSSSSSSSSGSTNIPSAGSVNNNEFVSQTKTIDTNSDTNNHSSNFHVQKNHGNLDDRHIVNLTEYSHLDDSVKLNRRPIMFGENNQNGDMFRPYVV